MGRSRTLLNCLLYKEKVYIHFKQLYICELWNTLSCIYFLVNIVEISRRRSCCSRPLHDRLFSDMCIKRQINVTALKMTVWFATFTPQPSVKTPFPFKCLCFHLCFYVKWETKHTFTTHCCPEMTQRTQMSCTVSLSDTETL